MTTSKTADDIRGVLDALNLDVVASYFDKMTTKSLRLRIPLRFLALDDGRIVIVELPTTVHESTARTFEWRFLDAGGKWERDCTTWLDDGDKSCQPEKEADATFGPTGLTLNRTPLPARRTVADWVTLAVEVGRSQPWASLEEAAQWWCNYSGIQYILLLKISATGIQMRYALYDIATLGTLPAPTTSGTFRRNNTGQPPANVSFDMHRILSIPANQALPPGVNTTALVDLRVVMNLVIISLR
ncbi:hypothetical protein PF003_g21902 [Phytophthora fragariae]|nr:hypothetical protein PF003_g21902 [Phytophthora fragariae]